MGRAFVSYFAVFILLVFAFGCGGGKHGGFNSGTNEPSVSNPKPLGDGRGTTVTFRITRGLFTYVNARWAAYRDGDGAWQVINPTTTGVYQFSISDSQGRYGFAFVVGNTVNIRYGTVSELTEWREQLSWVSAEFVVSGSATDTGTVIINGEGASIGSDKNYSVTVPSGIWDLIAYSPNSRRIYIQRDLSVNSNVVHNINFNDPVKSREWFEGGGYIFATSKEIEEGEVFLLSNRNTRFMLFSVWRPSEDVIDSYTPIPYSISHPNDVYVARVYVLDYPNLVETLQISSLPRDFIIVPPAPLIGIGGAGSVITGLRYNDACWWDVILRSQSITWFITFTAGWLGNKDSFTIPNFSGLPGWSNSWSLPSLNVSLSMVRVAVCNKPISQLMNAQWVLPRNESSYNDIPIRFLIRFLGDYPYTSFPKIDNLELKYATRRFPNPYFRLKKISPSH